MQIFLEISQNIVWTKTRFLKQVVPMSGKKDKIKNNNGYDKTYKGHYLCIVPDDLRQCAGSEQSATWACLCVQLKSLAFVFGKSLRWENVL